MALDGYIIPKAEYTHPDQGDDPSDDPYAVADLALTYSISEHIERWYPGHPWMVQVSHAQGVVLISIPLFMGKAHKYVLHIQQLKSDPGMCSVMRACGEILERYNLPRQRFSRDDFLNALEAIPINRRGSHGYVPA